MWQSELRGACAWFENACAGGWGSAPADMPLLPGTREEAFVGAAAAEDLEAVVARGASPRCLEILQASPRR